jgi:DNA topoisomerase-1
MILEKIFYLISQTVIQGKKAKNAQEAHEAIRPTDVSRKPADIKKYVNADQYKLYDLIWSRALSSQMNSG